MVDEAPKPRTRSTQPPKEEDVDDEEMEEKPEKKVIPARYVEKGLWRIHNAVFRVSFVIIYVLVYSTV